MATVRGERGDEAGAGGAVVAEAAVAAGVAGRAARGGEDQQGVAVAIGADVDEVEEIAAGLALAPRAAARAAVEGDEAVGDRRVERGAVHVAEHPHFAGGGVLDDGGDEAVHLGPVERVGVDHRRTSMALLGEIVLQVGDGDAAVVEHAGGERAAGARRRRPRRNAPAFPRRPRR